MTTKRTCTKCGGIFPETAEFFSRDGKALRGLERRCKQCAARQNRMWRNGNRNATPPAGSMRTCTRCKQQRPATLEHFSKSDSDKWGLLKWCRQCASDAQRERYHSDPEHRRAIIDRSVKRQRNLTPEQKASRRPLWAAAARRRKARMREAYGNHTAEDVRKRHEEQMGCCAYCYQEVRLEEAHVDHYIPIARGGRNDYFNLVIACPDCNHAKGARMPAEFAVYRAENAQIGAL